MAQRRMLSKTISTSKRLNKVGDQAALLFTWTLSHLDDYGNMDGSAEQLKFIVVPARKWTIQKVENLKKELCEMGAWIPYEVNKETYIHCEKFDNFQTFKKDRERLALYPKFKEELRKPLDSIGFQVEPLSEVKLSQDKLSELNSPPRKNARYLEKFQHPKKIYSSRHLLASEISEWSGGKLTIPRLMKNITQKGEQFTRQCWAAAKDSNGKDPIAIFCYEFGKVKITPEK